MDHPEMEKYRLQGRDGDDDDGDEEGDWEKSKVCTIERIR
jgi:hypothetical protein